MHSIAPLSIGRGKNRVPNAIFDSLNRIACSFPAVGIDGDKRRGSPSTAETIEANARLIAAAPDLLAVVQRLFHSVNGFSATFSAVNKDYACSQLRKEITETIREAQNAIAKATTS